MTESFSERLDRQIGEDAEAVRDEVVLYLTREQANHVYQLAEAHYWKTAADSTMSKEAREIFMNRSKAILHLINQRLTERRK